VVPDPVGVPNRCWISVLLNPLVVAPDKRVVGVTDEHPVRVESITAVKVALVQWIIKL